MRKQHRVCGSVRLSIGLAWIALFSLSRAPVACGNVYKSRINAQWSGDNSHFWYRNDLADGRREYVLVDVNKGDRREAFDHQRIAKALADAEVDNIDVARLPLDQMTFDLAANSVVLNARGRHFRCDLKTYELKPSEDPPTASMDAPTESEHKDNEKELQLIRYQPSRNVSPDGKWRAFGRELMTIERVWQTGYGCTLHFRRVF